ncbi:MAG: (Fe-S)-binding protein [Archaeoglobaceae archaeon]|nr:(Fe-S)-binding protein [Archaeoglobaceae archaeon]MCX8151804.1 (Fe-S)-binding protein [Archaeoglobaceae archaeon]MDW8013170.1 (Fe-S)-binding protein [Archaeoglobaceae archaeon]
MDCLRCAYCNICPIYRIEGWESVSPRGKIQLLDKKLSNRLVKDFYKCTVCGLCEVVCQSKLELTRIWEENRAKLVKSKKYMPAHKKIADAVLLYGNPYAAEQEARVLLNSPSNVLYFAGCMANFKVKNIAECTVKVLKLLGLEFKVAGKSEVCCGSTMLRTGFIDVAEKLFLKNVKNWQKMNVEKIITSCPGCYRTIKSNYPKIAEKKKIDFNFEVVHITQFLERELKKLDLKLGTVTYHDPCHLGRHSKVYEEPRNILKKIGYKIIEMERNRDFSICCGAGGGLRAQFPEISEKITLERILEAESTGAETLVTSCPFCVYQFSKVSRLKVRDVVEEVYSSMREVELKI